MSKQWTYPLCPFSGGAVVLLPVPLVLDRNGSDERIVGVWITQEGEDLGSGGRERAYAEEDLADGEGGGPCLLEDVEADVAGLVDVAVVDLCAEAQARGTEGVVGVKGNVEGKDAALVGGALGADDGAGPLHQVAVIDRRSTAVRASWSRSTPHPHGRIRDQVPRLLCQAGISIAPRPSPLLCRVRRCAIRCCCALRLLRRHCCVDQTTEIHADRHARFLRLLPRQRLKSSAQRRSQR
jgi:hypothetical protein